MLLTYMKRDKTKISQWKVFLEVSRLIQVKKKKKREEVNGVLQAKYLESIS